MSEGEELLAFQLRAMKVWEPVREYQFHGLRKWRFDFAWPNIKIAVEVEGGVWTGGRHTRGKGFIDDCEKYNQAALGGWMVLRFPVEKIKSGDAIKTILVALKLEEKFYGT